MGKRNRQLDPGVQYLQLIGFERIRGKYGLEDRLISIYGKDKAHALFDEWQKLDPGSLEFYDFKNSSYELSMAFNESYDGDIIRKACNYISSHKEYFGKEILEVGCESGSMTGFLATTFPDSHIVSIDRCEAALTIAAQRISKLNVDNVEFRCCSLEDVKGQFDTVFCMRTIQENIDREQMPFTGEPIIYQFLRYSELTDAYTRSLLQRIRSNGNICVFERVGHNPLMIGWMKAFNGQKCGLLMETYEEITCREVSEENVFQAFFARPGEANSTKELIALWYDSIDIDPKGKSELKGWNALVYLANNAGELVRGVYVLNEKDSVIGRFAVFKDRDEKSLIYYLYGRSEDDIRLFGGNASLLGTFLDQVQNAVDCNKKAGWTCREIDPDVDYIEGNRGNWQGVRL